MTLLRGYMGSLLLIVTSVGAQSFAQDKPNNMHHKQEFRRHSVVKLDPSPIIGISEDSSASCYADYAWADLQTTANTVQWTSYTGKNYTIQFTGTSPLVDKYNKPLQSVLVTSAGPTPQYHLTSNAFNACSPANAVGCYYQYDILDSGGVNSCVQHLGTYTIGIHVTP